MIIYGLAYTETDGVYTSPNIDVISFNFENLLEEYGEVIDEGMYSVFTISIDENDVIQLTVNEDEWEIYHGRFYREGLYFTNGKQLIYEDDYYGDEDLEGYEDCYVFDVYEKGKLKLSEQVEIITND